jgi:uncharacterized protein
MTSARILLASGGPTYAHDHAAAADALRSLLQHAGHVIVGITSHPSEIPAAISRERPDVVVSHMLWWRMLADRYDDLRDMWAYESSKDLREAVHSFVVEGGALVALHTSTICFDDWTGWGELLGARWNWDNSFHPPLGPVSVRLRARDETHHRTEPHPILAGLSDFITTDEVYMQLEIRGDVVPLAFARPTDAPDGTDHPILWLRSEGRGTIAHLGLGHDARALTNPGTAELIRRCVDWTVRSSRASSGY